MEYKRIIILYNYFITFNSQLADYFLVDQAFATLSLLKVNLSYKRLCANLGQSPKIADVSSSGSKEEVDYNVGNIYDREDSKKSVMEYVSDLVKQFLMKGQNRRITHYYCWVEVVLHSVVSAIEGV